jgi:hypothetical protein
MNKRRGDDAGERRDPAGINAKKMKLGAEQQRRPRHQPHEEDQHERDEHAEQQALLFTGR